MFEFESGTVLFYFSFTFVSLGESRLLVSWCAGASWCAVTWTVVGVGDLVQRTGDDRTGRVFGGWAVERSDVVMCGLHLARGDYERGFLG
jgi:hypothetical protein